jgi:hypothetical protein
LVAVIDGGVYYVAATLQRAHDRRSIEGIGAGIGFAKVCPEAD